MDISDFTIDELIDLKEEVDERLSNISRRLDQAGITPAPAADTAMKKLERALNTQLVTEEKEVTKWPNHPDRRVGPQRSFEDHVQMMNEKRNDGPVYIDYTIQSTQYTRIFRNHEEAREWLMPQAELPSRKRPNKIRIYSAGVSTDKRVW